MTTLSTTGLPKMLSYPGWPRFHSRFDLAGDCVQPILWSTAARSTLLRSIFTAEEAAEQLCFAASPSKPGWKNGV